MSQLQRGETFIDGQILTAARLNNLVDLAVALKGLILDQAASGVSINDQIVIWDDATNSLKRATLATLLADATGVTSVGLTMPAAAFNMTGPNPITNTGTFNVAWQAQSPNTVFTGPPSGGIGTPGFRALKTADMTVPTVTIPAAIVDWTTGSMFTKNLVANTNFGFYGAAEGQTIRVHLTSSGTFTAGWTSTVRWPGGTAPSPTVGLGRHNIYTFHCISGLYWGTFDLDFLP